MPNRSRQLRVGTQRMRLNLITEVYCNKQLQIMREYVRILVRCFFLKNILNIIDSIWNFKITVRSSWKLVIFKINIVSNNKKCTSHRICCNQALHFCYICRHCKQRVYLRKYITPTLAQPTALYSYYVTPSLLFVYRDRDFFGCLYPAIIWLGKLM